jgi:hypothetical protein
MERHTRRHTWCVLLRVGRWHTARCMSMTLVWSWQCMSMALVWSWHAMHEHDTSMNLAMHAQFIFASGAYLARRACARKSRARGLHDPARTCPSLASAIARMHWPGVWVEIAILSALFAPHAGALCQSPQLHSYHHPRPSCSWLSLSFLPRPCPRLRSGHDRCPACAATDRCGSGYSGPRDNQCSGCVCRGECWKY